MIPKKTLLMYLVAALYVPQGTAAADTIDRSLTVDQQKAQKIEPTQSYAMPSRRVTTAAFLGSEGAQLVLTSEQVEDAVSLFDAESAELIERSDSLHRTRSAAYAPEIEAVAPDGSFVVTTGAVTLPSVIFIKDGLQGQVLKGHPFRSMTGRRRAVPDEYVSRVFALSDAKTLLSVTNSGELLYWDRQGDQRFVPREALYAVFHDRYRSSLIEHPVRKVTAVALSPDEKVLALGLEDGRIAVYDLPRDGGASGELVPAAEHASTYQGSVTALAFGPGRSLAAAIDQPGAGPADEPIASRVELLTKELRLVQDLVGAVGSSIYDLLNDHPHYVVAVASSPESAIRVWSRRSKALVATARIERDPDRHYLSTSSGPYDPINRALLSRDKKHLVTGSDGGNLTVWRLPKLNVVQSTRAGQQIRALSLSPDGKRLVTGAHLGDARLYDWSSLVR